MSLAEAVNAAVTPPTDATPAPAPAAGTPAPEAPKGTEPATTEQAPPLFFHKKAAAKETVDLDTLDPSKLAPELVPIYKSMQADYTKKRQADAELRKQVEAEKLAVGETRKMLEEFLSKVAQGRTEAQAPETASPDIMEEIKALRENGDHAEADRKLMELWTVQQNAAMEPQRKEAQIKELRATFQEAATSTVMNDPLVQQYKDYVVTAFDSDNPRMNQLRQDILSSPERVKFYTPMVMRMLGYEAHIHNLETALETKVESLVQERIKAERLKAAGLPAKLVSSGATSREGAPEKMSLKESIAAAIEKHSTQ